MRLAKKSFVNEVKEGGLFSNEANFKFIFNHMRDAAFIADIKTGILLDANLAAEKLIGKTKKELIGMHQSRLHPDESEGKRVFDVNIKNNFSSEVESFIINNNKEVIPVLITSSKFIFNGRDTVLGVFKNISLRKRLESSLRESEEKYRTFFNQAPLGILHFDNKGVIVDCNEIFVSIIGSSRKALIGLNMLNLPDKKIVFAVKRAINGSTSYYEDDYHSVTANKVTPVRAFFSPIKSKDGKFVGGIGIIEDFTERKKFESELMVSKEKYKSTITSISDLVFVFDVNRVFTYFHAPKKSSFYVKPSLFVGKTFDKVMPKQVVELFDKAFSENKKGLVSNFNYYLTVNNKEKYFNANLSPIMINGSFTGSVAIVRDISDNVSYEKSLLKEKEWSERIINSAPNIIIGLGFDSKIIIFNAFAERITGYNASEVIGKEWIKFFIKKSEQKKLRSVWNDIFKNKRITHKFSNSILTKDGRELLISWSNTYIESNNQFNMILSIGEDITDKHKTEEAIRDLARFPEQNPNPVIKLDLKGKVLYVNSAAKKVINCKDAKKLFSNAKESIDSNKILRKDLECNHKWFSATFTPFKKDGYINIYAIDITEAKKANYSLEVSETRYRRLFEAARDGILILDFDTGMIVDVNPYLIEMLGYSHKEFLGKNIWEIGYFKDIAHSKKAFLELRKKGYIHYENLSLKTKSGKEFKAEFVSNVYRVDSKKVIQCNIRDITERKIAEDSLRESEEKFMTAFQSSPNLMAISTLDTGVFIDVNDSFLNSLGYTREEVINKSSKEINIFNDYKDRLRIVKTLNKKGVVKEVEVKIKTKYGQIRVLIFSAVPIKIKNNNYLLTIGNDVTERKFAQESLAKSEAVKKVLLDVYKNEPGFSDKQLFDYVLEGVVKVTDSKIGFFHVVDDDQKNIKLTAWNREAKRTCGFKGYVTHYPLSKAGNWVDCVRLKKPVVYNDFSKSPNQKGYPKGHVVLNRFMSIPVIEGGKVKFIFGVGNKNSDYNNDDIKSIELVAKTLSELLKQRYIYQALKESEEKLKSSDLIVNHAIDMLCIAGFDGYFKVLNPSWSKVLGYSTEELLSKPWISFVYPDDREATKNVKSKLINGQELYQFENRYVCKDGSIKWLSWNSFPYPKKSIMYGVARDITLQKESENLLKKSEETFRSLFENITEGIVTLDLKGKILGVNPMAVKMFGMPKEEVVGRNVFSFVNKFSVNPKEVLSIFKEVIKGKPLNQTEWHVKDINGKKAVMIISPWLNKKEGKAVSLTVSVKDITDLKKTEDKLAESEETFRNIFDNATDGMAVIDLKGRVINVNKRVAELSGYSNEELIGKHFIGLKFISSKNLLRAAKVFAKFLINPKSFVGTELLEIINKKGDKLIIEYKGFPFIKGNKMKGAVLILRDVTEKKRNEQLISLERDRLKNYMNVAEALILGLDLDGKISFINRKGCEILGVNEKEVIGKNWFTNFISKENIPKVKDEFKKIISSDDLPNELRFFENFIVNTNGFEKLISWSNALLKDENGRNIGVISYGEDITDKKIKEKEFDKLKKEDITNKARKDFLMLVTHELKQPLTPIMGYADILKEEITDVEKLKYLDRIIFGAQEMYDLINRIVSLMRIETGQLSFIYKDIDSEILVNDSITKRASMINLKNIKLVKDVKKFNFVGDYNLLRDVIVNLIDNAIKFSKNNSVIEISAKRRNNNALISVKDYGIGVRKEEIPDLFKTFSQTVEGRAHGGFGIGLSLCKMIVDNHKGVINVNSEFGKGSTFTVKIPLNLRAEKKNE